MSLEIFIGLWRDEIGNQLIIELKDKKSVSVTFLHHSDNKPVKRTYLDVRDSSKMHAELHWYGTSLEVELWKKGKGFHLCLMLDPVDNNELSPGISRYSKDKNLDKYYSLFSPFSRFMRVS
jgi:hypothetical protein